MSQSKARQLPPWNIRIDPSDLRLVGLAASVLGCTRTDFARRALVATAREVLRGVGEVDKNLPATDSAA